MSFIIGEKLVAKKPITEEEIAKRPFQKAQILESLLKNNYTWDKNTLCYKWRGEV